ncbi:MAG: hypothetical protein ACRC8S_00790 [Fimbriiglobus sp.]
MKIGCHCGATIFDQTDDLPQKGHLIPDQEWFAVYDEMDSLIDQIVAGNMSQEQAYHKSREIISRNAREMWQCVECGRLYIDGVDRQLYCFAPEGELVHKEILRNRSAR